MTDAAERQRIIDEATPTDEQAAFIGFVLDSFDTKTPGIAIVNSPGGTGKSHVIALLVKLLGDNIYVVAPTHKAKSILNNHLRANKADTFHRFFGAKSEYSEGGKLIFRFAAKQNAAASEKTLAENKDKEENENENENEETDFDEYGEPSKGGCRLDFDRKGYGVLVADECSMISSEILLQFEIRMRRTPGLVIFMGDSAQLPPVGENFSPVFAKQYLRYTFTKNKRARSQKIVEQTNFFRGPYNEASVVHSYGPPQPFEKTLREICALDRAELAKCVYLTFTNQKKNIVNHEIRQKIYGPKIERFEPGERLYFSGFRDHFIESKYLNFGLDSFKLDKDDEVNIEILKHYEGQYMLDKKKGVRMFKDCQSALVTMRSNGCLNISNAAFYSSDELLVTRIKKIKLSFSFLSRPVLFLQLTFCRAPQKDFGGGGGAHESESKSASADAKEYVWLVPSSDQDKSCLDEFFRAWSKRIRILRDNYDTTTDVEKNPHKKSRANDAGRKVSMEQEKKKEILRDIRNEWHNYWFLRKMLMPDLEYTYAMTIHKSQGSQWPLVYVDIPRLYMYKDGRRLIYTAVSRAQDRATFTF